MCQELAPNDLKDESWWLFAYGLILILQKNKDNIVVNDDKQKNCLHAFEAFINLFIGDKTKENETFDTLEV